jgi:hypothetical protein
VGVGCGYIETDLNTALMNDKAFSSWVEASTLAGRWSKVDEIVGSCIFRSNLDSGKDSGQKPRRPLHERVFYASVIRKCSALVSLSSRIKPLLEVRLGVLVQT